MSTLRNHPTYLHDSEHGEAIARDEAPIALIHSASQESIDKVLAADPNSDNGRSQFVWVRLANGDLILGVYPQGDTYFEVENDAQYGEDENDAQYGEDDG